MIQGPKLLPTHEIKIKKHILKVQVVNASGFVAIRSLFQLFNIAFAVIVP